VADGINFEGEVTVLALNDGEDDSQELAGRAIVGAGGTKGWVPCGNTGVVKPGIPMGGGPSSTGWGSRGADSGVGGMSALNTKRFTRGADMGTVVGRG